MQDRSMTSDFFGKFLPSVGISRLRAFSSGVFFGGGGEGILGSPLEGIST